MEAEEDILVNVDGDNLIGAGLDVVVMAVSIHLITKLMLEINVDGYVVSHEIKCLQFSNSANGSQAKSAWL